MYDKVLNQALKERKCIRHAANNETESTKKRSPYVNSDYRLDEVVPLCLVHSNKHSSTSEKEKHNATGQI